MTKKGKQHAQEPAVEQPEVIVTPAGEGGTSSAPEADLGVNDRSAADTGGAEHPPEPAAPDGDGEPGLKAEPSRDPATFLKVVMESGLFDEYSETAREILVLIELQPPTSEPPVLLFTSEDTASIAGEGYSDGAIYTANCAAFAVLDYIREHQEIPDPIIHQCDLLALADNPDAANSIAVFVRQIGRDRAAPVVIGQQLKILGYRESGDLDPVEELVYATFARTLCDIDEYGREEERRHLALMLRPVERQPVPIEDTIMEPLADPMETF